MSSFTVSIAREAAIKAVFRPLARSQRAVKANSGINASGWKS